jgi:hypothetical protein
MGAPPDALRRLVDRYDPEVFEVARARVRLCVGEDAWDAVVTSGAVRLEPA